MVPRDAIAAVPRDGRPEDAVRARGERGYARVLVFERSRENVTGYVALKDLVAPAARSEASVAPYAHPARFVPLTMPAMALLREMQTDRLPLVVATDETGDVRGLVTVEDLLEELVGDILSERDPAPPTFDRAADGSVVVAGATPIRDVNRALDLGLEEPDTVTTIAGLCIAATGHVPSPGERVALPSGVVLQVIDASLRKVHTLRIHPTGPIAAPDGQA